MRCLTWLKAWAVYRCLTRRLLFSVLLCCSRQVRWQEITHSHMLNWCNWYSVRPSTTLMLWFCFSNAPRRVSTGFLPGICKLINLFAGDWLLDWLKLPCFFVFVFFTLKMNEPVRMSYKCSIRTVSACWVWTGFNAVQIYLTVLALTRYL